MLSETGCGQEGLSIEVTVEQRPHRGGGEWCCCHGVERMGYGNSKYKGPEAGACLEK